MNWTVILPILQMIFSAVSPALKQVALAELQTIAAGFPNNPVLEMLVAEAEKVVAAL